MTRTTASARSRAEAALAALNIKRLCGERGGACLADASNGPQSCTVWSGDKHFVVADQAFAVAIAGLARSHQVVRILVTPIAIDVISYEHHFAGTGTSADYPANLATAPVTRMPARTDTVIEEHPRLSDITILCHKWMVWCVDHATHARDWFSSWPCHVSIISRQYYGACLP